jgi:hypothetical protein
MELTAGRDTAVCDSAVWAPEGPTERMPILSP